MRRTKFSFLIASGLALCLQAQGTAVAADCNNNLIDDDSEFLGAASVDYQETPNAPNSSLGWASSVGENIWLVAAEAQPGGNYIDQVSMYFSNSWTRGEHFVCVIMDDPNNDGNPADAVMLREVEGRVNATGGWQTVTFSPPVYVGDGGEGFFHGLVHRIHRSRYPMTIDTTTPTTKFWANALPLGSMVLGEVNALNMSALGYPASPLIKARGKASVLPDCNGSGVMDSCETDCDAPFVVGLNRLQYSTLPHGEAIFEVKFSEQVENVDMSDFTVATTGSLSGVGITAVEDSLDRVRIRVSTGSGVGTIGLNLVDDGSIMDMGGAKLQGGGASSLPYQVDNRQVHVASVTRLDAETVAAGPVSYEVQFDSPVTGAIPSRFKPTAFGPTAAAVTSVTPQGVNPFDEALDLTAASQQYGTVPAGTYFNGPFTIEGWVMPKSHTSWGRLVDFSNGAANDNVFLSVSSGTSGLITGGIYNGVTPTHVTAPAALPLNRWSHVAFVFDGTDGIMYLNGIEVARNTMPTPNNVVRNTCYVGRSPWVSDGYADMQIDDVRIWAQARTRQEIVNNITTQLTGAEFGLTAAWKFNEGSGTTVADVAMLGHDMTLVNSPAWVASDVPGISSYHVTVTGTGEGLLGLDMISSGPFDTAGRAAANLAIPYYRLDGTDPMVASVMRASSNPTAGNQVTFAVEFTEPVTGSDAADFSVAETGVSGSSVASVMVDERFAMGFDGTGDHVSIGAGALAIPTEEITIEFWQYANTAKSQSTFGLTPDVYANRVNAHVPYTNGAIYWDFGDIYNGGRLFYTPPVSITGSWQHFALVSSVSENVMRIYRNGVLEAEQAGASSITPQEWDLNIGKLGNGAFFDGMIREFRVWDHVRTGQQINDNMNGELDGNEPGLAMYHSFSGFENLGAGEPGTNDVADKTGNGWDGDVIGDVQQLPTTTTHYVNVQTGAGCGDVALQVVDNDSVTDAGGRSLGGVGAGNGSFGGGESFAVDREAPTASIISAPATKVGGDVKLDFTSNDTCSGIASEVLYARESADVWQQDATATMEIGAALTTPAGDGVWHFAVVPQDDLGNIAVPAANSVVAGEAQVIYNDVANSSFSYNVPAGAGGTYVFPMEEMGVTVTVTLPQVFVGGTLTVTRFEDNSPASSAGLGTQHLVNQMILIQATGLVMNGTSTVELPYEESLLGTVAEGAINTVYAIDGGVVTTYDAASVSVNQGTNMVTVSGVNGFSEWYVGSSTATVSDWETLDY